ncbi:MAG TPA: alcohol dehydrogenase catalytic domain-containing protein [Streptosporangiaceae bacterium]
MKALVLAAAGAVEMRDEPEPRVSAGERLVHVRSTSICGSELHGARTPGFRKPPLIMGHEFAGVTEEGDPVIVNPILSCGTCGLCRTGRRQICEQRRIIGVHRPGGFAERVAVPSSTLRPVPPGLTWEAAALVEPAANAVHAWNLARAAAGATAGPDGADGTGLPRVAVIGCGAIGLLCLLAALAGGAGSVDVTDLSAQRLTAARHLGATAAAAELDGEYDIVFDAVGSAETRAESVLRQRPGGVAVWLGLAAAEAGFDAAALVRSEKRVLGSFAYSDQDFGLASTLLAGWDLCWTSSYPLSSGAEVFTDLMNGALQPIKAVLQP